VWIAASTREGEDAKVLRAMQLAMKKCPRCCWCWCRAIRSVSRSRRAGGGCRIYRATLQQRRESTIETQVLVGDTMGDMHFYYALADVAFVGVRW